MRRGILALVVGLALLAGCTGGVDTNTPPPGDDDDDGGTTPTPTPTGTATATPTPAPGLVGDPWTTVATPPSQVCSVVIEMLYGNAGNAVIGIGQTGSNIYFDVGLHLNPEIGIGTEPSGTVDGAGNFTQTFSYCTYDTFNTHKIYATWTGTFAPDGLSFSNSTLSEQLYVRNSGDYRSTCATSVDTTYQFGDCSTPGVTFTVDGTKQ